MEFYEKFKSYSNTDLLRIIENPTDYQPQAVETAKVIFSERQLSEMELQIAQDEFEIEKQEKSKKEQQNLGVQNKVKNIGKSILDKINPIQKKTPTSSKAITTISILVGGLFLFQLYNEFGMLRFMFTDSYAKWDFSMALYFFPLLVVPIAAILFFMRKKTGWFILVIFLVYSAVSTIGLFILTINRIPLGVSGLNNLFPQIIPLKYILSFIFFAGIIWAICRDNIRISYAISKQTMFLVVAITSLLVGLGVIITFSFF